MSKKLTVHSNLVAPKADKPLTPAMLTALWVINDTVDKLRIEEDVENSVWIEVPTAKLRGPEGRNDNFWLRKCLDRLMGIKLHGEYRGNPWGAVFLSEYQIINGGGIARISLTTAAIKMLKAPSTFAKVEQFAAYKLDGYARRLYGLLADKKRVRGSAWTYDVDELRTLLALDDKPAYARWNNLKFRVLDPAIAAISEYGTINVEMFPQKVGRSVKYVRFEWTLKTPDEAKETDEENQKSSVSRRKKQTTADLSPLDPQPVPLQELPANGPIDPELIPTGFRVLETQSKRLLVPIKPAAKTGEIVPEKAAFVKAQLEKLKR